MAVADVRVAVLRPGRGGLAGARSLGFGLIALVRRCEV